MSTALPASDFNRWIGTCLCLILGAGVALACWFITGASLDLFLGSVALATLLTPSHGSCCRINGLAAMVCGISTVWLIPVFSGAISFVAWIGCTLVLASFMAAILSTSEFLAHFIAPVSGAAIVTFLSLAWLTWPIWLTVAGPTAIHPIFAINSACQNLGIWTEQRFAYHLTRLGQDIPYRLPGSVWPTVCFNTTVAVILNVFRLIARKKGTSSR